MFQYHKLIQPYSKRHGNSLPWEMNYNWFCTMDGILTLHLLSGDYCKVDTKYICCLALHLDGQGFPWASHAALAVPKHRCHGGSPALVVLPPPHAQPLPICFSLHPLSTCGVQLSSGVFFNAQSVSSSRRISLRLCGRRKMKYLQQPVCGWFERRRVSTMSFKEGVRYKSPLQTARVHSRLQRHLFVWRGGCVVFCFFFLSASFCFFLGLEEDESVGVCAFV